MPNKKISLLVRLRLCA